jgi:membrane associated rhomboid family serine protease
MDLHRGVVRLPVDPSVVSFGDISGGGGVAYSAHVGGFITGLLLVRAFSHAGWVEVIRARQADLPRTN